MISGSATGRSAYVDNNTGKTLAGTSWIIHKTNPFIGLHAMEATWFPNDSSRTFAEEALENYGRPRFDAAQRPHIRNLAL